MRRFLALLLLVALPGCAGLSDVEPMAPPARAELDAYVQAHWGTYEPRFASWAKGAGESPQALRTVTYVALGEVACSPYYVVYACDFVVVGRLADGRTIDQKLYSQFERTPDGALSETMLLVEQRRR